MERRTVLKAAPKRDAMRRGRWRFDFDTHALYRPRVGVCRYDNNKACAWLSFGERYGESLAAVTLDDITSPRLLRWLARLPESMQG